ncbi:hypothetical protein OK074_6703 [Actinobacteria bacterium OK074]|nr:hypothetical protein OK074_6703 [Actinobacteria bacterium OK074]
MSDHHHDDTSSPEPSRHSGDSFDLVTFVRGILRWETWAILGLLIVLCAVFS